MVDPWFVRFRRDDTARLRLVCFPFAGGGAGFFRPWQERWTTDVEVAALQLPGRGARFQEKPFTRLEPMLDAMLPAIVALGDRPFAFFGHSMGARVAFEVTQRLRARGGPMPVHLFLSGSTHPMRRTSSLEWHKLPDDPFVSGLRRLGGTPEEVLRNNELMQLMVPLLRADFEAMETHRHEPQPPLDVPIDALGGTEDPAVSGDDLEEWRHSTTRRFSRRMFPGGHFYLQTGRAVVLHDIAARLHDHLGHQPDLRHMPAAARERRAS